MDVHKLVRRRYERNYKKFLLLDEFNSLMYFLRSTGIHKKVCGACFNFPNGFLNFISLIGIKPSDFSNNELLDGNLIMFDI